MIRVGTRAPSWRRRLCSLASPQPAPPRAPSDALLRDAATHWQSLVASADAGASLLRDGYCVLRGAFPAPFTALLRDEMQYLHATDQMYANATHILLQGEQQPTLLEKHHIVETELVLPEVRAQVPALQWFFDSQQVFSAVQRATPSWLGLSGYMIKLQYNEGHGGCFPMHFDSYGDDGKCITAVLYLNENWQQGDGGEIVLYPFPRSQKPVVVRPRDGDLVLFSSQQMLHRVLPASKPRFCLTTWIYSSPDQQLAAQHRAAFYKPDADPQAYRLQVVHKVMRSSFRRHLAKLAYSQEWENSLVQSHRQTLEFAKYMATHEREVGVIEAATAQMLAKFRAKDPTQPSTVPEVATQLLEAMQHDDKMRRMLELLSVPWF